MMAQTKGWLAGLLVLSSGAISTRAAACSCVNVGPLLVWPQRGAAPVPLDTPLVFQSVLTPESLAPRPGAQPERPAPPLDESPLDEPPPEQPPTDPAEAPPASPLVDAGNGAPLPPRDPTDATDAGVQGDGASPSPSGVYLRASDGVLVRLEETSSRPTPGCGGDYRFFESSAGPLEPNTSYGVFFGETEIGSFTTNDRPRDRTAETAAARAVEIATLGTLDAKVATAFVTNVTAPLFVHYVGSMEEVTYPLWNGVDPAAFDVGDVKCPVVELLGVDGEMLDARRLCEPTRCTDLGNTRSLSSCGGNPSVGVGYDAFTELPLGCGEVTPDPTSVHEPAEPPSAPAPSSIPSSPAAESGSGHSEPPSPSAPSGDQPEPVKIGVDGASSPSANGCAVSGSRGARDGSGTWLVAVAGLVAVVIGRRRA